MPCAIQYKINICCYFSKLKSDVKLFLQGDSGTKKDRGVFFFSSLLTKVAIFYARRRFWRGLK